MAHEQLENLVGIERLKAEAPSPAEITGLKLPIPDDRRGTPCGCPAGSHRSAAVSPFHIAIPGARKDADPSRRLESRRSISPGSVVPKQWPADGGAVRGRATTHTRVAPTSRSTAATRWAPLMENPAQFLVGSCRRPAGGGLLSRDHADAKRRAHGSTGKVRQADGCLGTLSERQ